MKPEETQELKELIEFLKEHNIGEFDLERGDLKVRIKFAHETSGVDMAQMAACWHRNLRGLPFQRCCRRCLRRRLLRLHSLVRQREDRKHRRARAARTLRCMW